MKIIRKQITASTSADVREMIESTDVCGDFMVIADEQTAGRGRSGKSFLSPLGGLYFSLSIPCPFPINEAVSATSCAAVAVVRVLDRVCGIDCGIKWVNDIYVGRRKLCGILTEAVHIHGGSVSSSHLIIGIGMNLASSPTVTTSSVKAISLAECGVSINDELRFLLASRIGEEIFRMRDGHFDFPAVRDEYISHSLAPGHEITYTQNGITKTALAVGIDARGGLEVISEGEKLTLTSGEISVRLK